MNIKGYFKETIKYTLRSPYVIRHYISEVDRLYSLPTNELRAYKERRFLEIFRKAWDKSTYYRNLCQENGVKSADEIQCLEDIVKLPILTKDMLKAHGDELLTRGKRGLVKNHTSGTTGTPLTVYEDWPALWREQAYIYCYRKRCGFTYGEPLVSLRGNLTRKDIAMKIHASNTLFLSSYNINENTAELYFNLIARHHPKAIEAYPSSLYSLALAFRDKKFDCRIPIAFTSSESMYDYQRKIIEEVFHTQIFDHYGTTERTISLEESFNHDGYFESPGYGIEEYNDDFIITTSLINDAFPLIRYKTEDRIVLKEGVTKTREGFIENDGVDCVQGRSISYLIGKNNTKFSDSSLTFVFKEISGVEYAQFVQTKPGSVDLNIVTNASFDANSRTNILKYIDKTIGLSNIDLDIHKVDKNKLIYTKNGKLALIVSCNPGGAIPLVASISGRSDDYIICKDGTIVTRVDFVEEGKHFKACQWIQEVPGKVKINIAPDNEFTKLDEKYIINSTLERCGKDNIDIQTILCPIEKMEYSKTGKFRLIINKINANKTYSNLKNI